MLTLLDIKKDEEVLIEEIKTSRFVQERLHSFGLIRGTKIRLFKKSPLDSPRIYSYLNTKIALRNSLARKIKVKK